MLSSERRNSAAYRRRKISFADLNVLNNQVVHDCLTNMEKFEELLHGLAELDDDGYVHQVYSAVFSAVEDEKMVRLLAESLHQRWMSDNGFAPVAARLANKLSDLQTEDCDFQFGSMIYAMFMNDYRDRLKLRASNPIILCNCTQFGFEFYNHFRHKGAFYEGLIDPLLDMIDLMMSAEGNGSEHEIECASHLLQIYGQFIKMFFIDTLFLEEYWLFYIWMKPSSFMFPRQKRPPQDTDSHQGAHLQAQRHKRMMSLVVRVRRILILSEGIGAKIRYRLLEIIELSQNRWDPDNLSTDVVYMYEDMRDNYGDHYISVNDGFPIGNRKPSLLQASIPPPPLKHRSVSQARFSESTRNENTNA